MNVLRMSEETESGIHSFREAVSKMGATIVLMLRLDESCRE